MKVRISDEVWKLVSPKLSRIIFLRDRRGKAYYLGLLLNNLTVSLKSDMIWSNCGLSFLIKSVAAFGIPSSSSMDVDKHVNLKE